MAVLRLLSAAEQVAVHLRGEVMAGIRSGEMPGVSGLAKELGVNHKTVEAALGLLEREGLLVGQGPRRRRRIELPVGGVVPQAMRVKILVCEPEDRELDFMVDLHHALILAGHLASYASRTLYELGRNVKRIARFVERTEADAWVILGGAHEELQWFAGQPTPAFALLGRGKRVSIASIGPDKLPAMRSAVRRLVDFGHRRIVLLVRPERRRPGPGLFERAFLGELESHGIPPGSYHLPDWEESPAGFHAGLESLFRVTPPSALLIDETLFVTATFQFCSRHGIRIPEDVSLLCTDPDPCFGWCRPPVAHIHWESSPWVVRIMRWMTKVSRGMDDRRQSLSKAEFVDGGTIGPVAG